MTPLAELSFERVGTVLVTRVVGEVDLSNVEQVRAGLVDAITQELESFVLDLTDTTYLDSTGVRLLFDLAERLEVRRLQLRLVVRDQAVVRRVLVLSQLDARVPLDPDVEASLAAATRSSPPGAARSS